MSEKILLELRVNGERLSAAARPGKTLLEVLRAVERSLDALGVEFADVPPRQRSLRAVFERSVGLLSPDLRSALARLAVIRGTFGDDEARALVGDGGPAAAAALGDAAEA